MLCVYEVTLKRLDWRCVLDGSGMMVQLKGEDFNGGQGPSQQVCEL